MTCRLMRGHCRRARVISLARWRGIGPREQKLSGDAYARRRIIG